MSALLRRRTREDGFTLIEILVVVLIIGVLASIAIPIYLNQTKKAKTTALKADLSNAAILMYQLTDQNNGQYIFNDQWAAQNTVPPAATNADITLTSAGITNVLTPAPGSGQTVATRTALLREIKVSPRVILTIPERSKGKCIQGVITQNNVPTGSTFSYDITTKRLTEAACPSL